MWNFRFLFFLIGGTLAAELVLPLQPIPQKYNNSKGCFIKELDKMVKIGEGVPSLKECLTYLCTEKNVILISCDQVETPLLCKVVENKTLLYPECCRRIHCEAKPVLKSLKALHIFGFDVLNNNDKKNGKKVKNDGNENNKDKKNGKKVKNDENENNKDKKNGKKVKNDENEKDKKVENDENENVEESILEIEKTTPSPLPPSINEEKINVGETPVERQQLVSDLRTVDSKLLNKNGKQDIKQDEMMNINGNNSIKNNNSTVRDVPQETLEIQNNTAKIPEIINDNKPSNIVGNNNQNQTDPQTISQLKANSILDPDLISGTPFNLATANPLSVVSASANNNETEKQQKKIDEHGDVLVSFKSEGANTTTAKPLILL